MKKNSNKSRNNNNNNNNNNDCLIINYKETSDDDDDILSFEDDDLLSLYQRTHEIEHIRRYTYSSCSITSSTSQTIAQYEEEGEDDDDILIVPQNLSPEQRNYQFPIIHNDEIGKDPFTVTQKYHKDSTVFLRNETALSFYSNMSSDLDPSTSFRTNDSHKLVLKLTKSQSCTVIYEHGDMDDDCELDSECSFYPVKDQEEEELAAIKIQSLWRGYQTRKEKKKNVKNGSNNDELIQLFLLCGRFHQQKINHFEEKLSLLEAKVQEEQAMRVAFETAMEDLTELIDQQQKMLYDRLDQQIRMRRSCETKMKGLLKSLDPLELRLQQETEARKKLEVTMSRVLEDLQDTKASLVLSSPPPEKQQQIKKMAASPRRPIIPERPSVIPSRRRPIASTNHKQESSINRSGRASLNQKS